MSYPYRISYLAAVAAAFALGAAAQTVTPTKGQSKDQQQQDQAECAKIASNQTGFDPSAPPPAVPQGAKPGSGMRGAAAGAVIAGASGGDTGQGAAAGAVVARGASRRQGRRDQAAADEQQQDAGNAYNQAVAACLGGKGYSVSGNSATKAQH
jgi:hypothetical protein